MKQKIFAVFTFFAVLLLASCAVANTPLNKEADNSNEAYITLCVKQDGNRTALPYI